MSKYILGSRSPRRLELLQLLVPADRIQVLPPADADELDFANCLDWQQIEERMKKIALQKWHDVQQQMISQASETTQQETIITADTVIIVPANQEPLHVLGQPPQPGWQTTVRSWFLNYYAGKSHFAATALCVGTSNRAPQCRVSKSEIGFHNNIEPLVDWYLQTGEPIGKAGGYAVQGAGSIFISEIRGSLSNIIGLPLELLREMIINQEA